MKKNIEKQIERMRLQPVIKGAHYYSLTLSASHDDRITWSFMSHWIGFTNSKPQREIRIVSEVDPKKAISLFQTIGQPALIVNDEEDLFLYLLFGGHAVIETNLCKHYLPDITKPNEIINSTKGMICIDSVPKEKLYRAPSKKLRMNVIKRDNGRCRICGRSPNDYVDIELHVHHIRPWGLGGVTEENNLITLCNTCHDGLDPHFERWLFSYIEVDQNGLSDDNGRKYIEGVQNYRRLSFRSLSLSR